MKQRFEKKGRFTPMRPKFNGEARLSWALSALAGLLGATAFTHSTEYFVTSMTGTGQLAVLGSFRDQRWVSITAGFILLAFILGVVTASLCRRHLCVAHAHGSTVLTTLSVTVASAIDVTLDGWSDQELPIAPILLIAFGLGALNTSFVKDGEVSIPLSYVTGTVVKMAQGIERHISGGSIADWLGNFLLFGSFTLGVTIGACMHLMVTETAMLAIAAVVCALTTGCTYFHADRRALLKAAGEPLADQTS